jgi:hypothetical protein
MSRNGVNVNLIPWAKDIYQPALWAMEYHLDALQAG